jgi:hypothetical protein
MRSAEAGRHLEQLARELDLVVFRLEQAARSPEPIPKLERDGLQRELESLRDRIENLSRDLGQEGG